MTVTTFDEPQAARLARGFPHLRELVDDHPDDAPKRVDKAAKKVASATDPVYPLRWPREVAARFLRAFALGRVGSHPSLGGEDAEAEAKRAGPVTDVEAIVRAIVLPPKEAPRENRNWGRSLVYPYEVADVVYLLEALFGPERVLSAVLDTFDRLVDEERTMRGKDRAVDRTNYGAAYLVIPCGMLMLRAGSDAARAARARLEPHASDPLRDDVWALSHLDMLLHGREAVARSGYSWAPPVSWILSDDPAWVREAIASAKGERDLDVRGVWLGGEEVLELYAPFAAKARAADVPHLVECFSIVQSPKVALVMAGFATKKGGEGALAWIREHRELAQPELERAARGRGKDAKIAASALAALERGSGV
jgi:hypothetical protein